jgi:hypothetical protein
MSFSLSALVTTAQQGNQDVALLGNVNPVTGIVVDPQFADARVNSLPITLQTCC